MGTENKTMITRYKFMLLFLVTLISLRGYPQEAKEQLLEKEIYQVVEELTFMYDYDQALREYHIYKTFNKAITDSLELLDNESRERYVETKQYKSNFETIILTKYIVPSDARHTERLLEIVKTYGFPSMKRLKRYYKGTFDKEFNPLIIFIHSPKKYFDELKIVMEKEYKQKRISKCQYGYLLWHLNGRNNLSYFLDYGYKYIETNGIRRLAPVDCE